MICPKCHQEIPDGLKYCPRCGERIDNTSDEQPIPETALSASQETSSSEILLLQKKLIKLGTICMALLIIIALGVLLTAFTQISHNSSDKGATASDKILLVEVSGHLEEDDVSDSVQIEAALRNGGQMRVNTSLLDSSYQALMSEYGASDSEGMYWTNGAWLNYIASQGWELVGVPGNAVTGDYCFIKKK